MPIRIDHFISCLNLRSLLIAVVSLLSLNVLSQHESIDPALKSKLRSNQYFLSKYSIELNNGNIPFQEHKKWGIKNGERAVIQPIYDTLINLTYDFFAAKNDTTCQLFDMQLNAYFDQSVTQIIPTSVFQELKVRDKSGQTSYYQISKEIAYDNDQRQFLVSTIRAKDTLNSRLLANPISANTDRSNVPRIYALYLTENNYCDSITINQLMAGAEAQFQFYRKGRKYGELIYDNVMIRYTCDSILVIETRKKGFFSSTFLLINTKTLNEITHFEGELGRILKIKDHYYIWAFQSRMSYIYDLSGKVIETHDPKFSIHGSGCFRKEINRQEETFDLYSFPDQKLLYSNLKQIRENDGFYLFEKTDTKEVLLFYNDQFLYSFKGTHKVVFYSTKERRGMDQAL